MLNRIKKENGSYVDDSLLYEQVSYSQSINTETDLQVGCVVSASITFATRGSLFNVGDKIYYECKQHDDSSYVQKGIFYVDSVENSNNKYTVTAYDAIAFTDDIVDSWISTLNDDTTYTIAQLLNGLCTSMNYPNHYSAASPYSGLNANIGLKKLHTKLNNTNTTGRTILQYIAAFTGSFIVANASDGGIEIKHFANAGITIDNSKYINCTAANYFTPQIECVRAAASNDDTGISYPTTYVSGQTELTIIGNLLFTVIDDTEKSTLQTAVNNIYNYISPISYKPISMELFQDFGIECGDIITVESKQFYVFSKELTPSGCKLSCTGNSTRSTSLTYNQELADISGKTASFKVSLDGITARVTDAESNISTLSQTASALTTRITDAEGNISTLSQTVGGISTRVSTAEGNISTLSQTATQLTTRITNAEGDISTVSQTVDGLSTRVSDAEGNISTLSQTVSGISTRVTTAEGNISTLSQTATSLTSRITNTEGDVSEIEQTMDGVMFRNSGGTTVINGSNITTGQIQANVINGDGLNVSNAVFNTCTIKSNCTIEGSLTADKIEVKNGTQTMFLADNTVPEVIIDGAYITNSTVETSKLTDFTKNASGVGTGSNFFANSLYATGTSQGSDFWFHSQIYSNLYKLTEIISDIDDRLYALEHPTTTYYTISATQKCGGVVGTYGTVTGTGQVEEGRYTTLYATANSGYTFDHWEYPAGTTVGSLPAYTTPAIYENRTYIAVFTVGTVYYNLTLTTDAAHVSAGGYITVDGTTKTTGTYSYESGLHEVEVHLNSGYYLAVFTGSGGQALVNPATINLIADTTITFSIRQTPTITVTLTNDWSGMDWWADSVGGEVITSFTMPAGTSKTVYYGGDEDSSYARFEDTATGEATIDTDYCETDKQWTITIYSDQSCTINAYQGE